MIEALRLSDVEVIECHESLWRGIEDRVQAASGGWLHPAFAWRVLRTYIRLIYRYLHIGKHDILVVGYPGQLDVFLARVLSWLNRKPLAWDVFMSIYLIARERGLAERSWVTVSLLRRLEWLACRLPDLLIIDTEDYAAWFGATHGILSSRFRLVPTGADSRVFHPLDGGRRDTGYLQVLYYGSFIPNHGVCTIVEAARLLACDRTIRFELVGDGPDKDKAMALATNYALSNITFHDWLDKPALLAYIADSDICLGAFGTTPQSLMTVQNKIYESLAMAKAVISGDSPAVRRLLHHGEHLYLCSREDATDLAAAIRVLRYDPVLRQRLADNGRRIFVEQFDLAPLGRRYEAHLKELLCEVAHAG